MLLERMIESVCETGRQVTFRIPDYLDEFGCMVVCFVSLPGTEVQDVRGFGETPVDAIKEAMGALCTAQLRKPS
jgi:hypothetical protein